MIENKVNSGLSKNCNLLAYVSQQCKNRFSFWLYIHCFAFSVLTHSQATFLVAPRWHPSRKNRNIPVFSAEVLIFNWMGPVQVIRTFWNNYWKPKNTIGQVYVSATQKCGPWTNACVHIFVNHLQQFKLRNWRWLETSIVIYLTE